MSTLFGGGGGGGVSADRSNQLGSWANLNNVSGYGTSSGENDINQGSSFWSGILSGDPTKIAQTIAPQAKIIRGQAQQQKNQLAQFGTRSGGTGGAAQQIDSNATGSIDNLINSLIPQAATSLTGLGTNLLGLSTQASSTVGSQAEQAREFDQQEQDKESSGIGSILSGGLGNIGSGGSFLEDLGQFGLGALGI